MRGRWGTTLLLVAVLTVAGPGTVSLQAGEAPQDRGRPSEGESPGDRAPETPPGQESDGTQSGDTQDGGTTGPASDTGGGPAGDEQADDGPAQDPTTTGGPVNGTAGDTDAGGGGAGGATPQPPPPPEPDLTGTRVLRSLLGTAREVGADGEAVTLRDLRVAVTETGASGIDGGWWVTVTTPDGEVVVTPPTLDTAGNGGVPRAPDEVSVGGGPLFWISGQRSDQRYEGRYEAQGTIGIPSVGGTEKPVVTILLVQ